VLKLLDGKNKLRLEKIIGMSLVNYSVADSRHLCGSNRVGNACVYRSYAIVVHLCADSSNFFMVD